MLGQVGILWATRPIHQRCPAPTPLLLYNTELTLFILHRHSLFVSSSVKLATRIAASESLAIRGAARPTAAGRVRRNAISLNTGKVPGARIIATSRSSLEVWREFVQKRYSPETRFLNLERMSEDPLLGKARLIPPGVPGSSGKEAAVIFKLASHLKPPVRSLSLANNHLSSTHGLSTIAHYLPDLANLSLENNNLRTWKDIDTLSQLSDKKDKLKNLRELILLGNPVRERQGADDQYKNHIIRRFPTLEMLDKEAVAKIAFDNPAASTSSTPHTGPVPTATTFPAEMRPPFVAGVDGNIIVNFFARFFPLFDSQRAGLIDVYHESATFSFQANTSIPARARIQGFQYSKEMPHQRHLEWSAWLGAGSRNLSRVAGAVDKMVKSLHVGREEVVKAITSLPRMRHEVASSPEKFCIDAWPVTQGEKTTLFLSVHGQFTEEPVGGIRSFDRSFILAPATPESRARLNGWDVEILSDQLVVRGYSSHEAWKPGAMLVQAAAAPSIPSIPEAQASLLNSIPEPQRSLVVQISQRTGLNVRFSVDCLQGNGWDLDKAMANFEQVKVRTRGTLGREAFL
ncbi:hypothetical protein EW146_g226 [Bondarzewia mesenterica]|uniref:NTF2-like protein n=1 Tax=Bondarzewia mesenterica TaxID=1095465 RepID=A0A4V3XGG3_9AGAM|nr:hypothetical protein EW146_g226 [Bondarzewia mesenterica]